MEGNEVLLRVEVLTLSVAVVEETVVRMVDGFGRDIVLSGGTSVMDGKTW